MRKSSVAKGCGVFSIVATAVRCLAGAWACGFRIHRTQHLWWVKTGAPPRIGRSFMASGSMRMRLIG